MRTVARLFEMPSSWVDEVGVARFGGSVEGADRMLEQGPGWSTVADALEWARSRADVVWIRVLEAGQDVTYSAGVVHPDADVPVWRD